ncbi:hypothetical protein GCM10023156_30730 [Novipirellula rosea]|uniref:Glycosyl transferase family 1 domain-containing protein n=1 Tax=Novipirellula rosea TaxID=1031540 RepID=A0ABP8MTS8_9BACT
MIPNGVDLAQFSPVSVEQRASIRKKLDLPLDEPIAVMVGRLWPQKDPLTFVEAAIKYLSRHAAGHFVLLGDGDLRSEIETLINQHGVSDRVHLLGWRDDVDQLLPAFDLFVLPSLWEGMPLAILEALACGLPCIVTDIPGNRDLVEDGEDGFLLPTNDATTLADHLTTLLCNESLRKSMGERARLKVVNEYDLAKRTQRVISLYEQILGR